MASEVIGTKENFKTEVLDADVVVLVDFWAEWCVPCRMVAPILEKMAADHAGKLKVVKVNVDEQVELAAEHNIVSIPTLMVFNNGQNVGKQIGAASRAVMEKLVADHLA